MRWFTFIVTIVIILVLLFFAFVVTFVLENREMFETTFSIIMPFPYHVWENVKFVYIIIGSFLLGLSVAVILTVTSLILDTKRALKLKSMRKELGRLQEALQEAQTEREVQEQEKEEQLPEIEEEPVEFTESSPATPEEIAKSFEDTVENSDFLENVKKRREEEQTDQDIHESDEPSSGDVYEQLRDKEAPTEEEPTEELVEEEPTEADIKEDEEDSTVDEDQKLSEETPVEAEIVEKKEPSEEEQETKNI